MIVSAKINHLNEIFIIELKSFDNPWSFNQIKYDLEKNTTSANWVYIQNNQVVGYVMGFQVNNEYHLNNFAVHPNYIRNKIGTRLILHIASNLKLKEINVILLEVNSNNIPARKCYESLGFKSVGKRKNYYSKGEDAILYNLDILNG